MATQLTATPTGGGAALVLDYRYFDRFGSEDLNTIRQQLDQVLDDRARQYELFGEPPAVPVLTAAKPDWAAQLNGDLAGVLSPSQVACWLDCQAKWYFKYFRGLPDITTSGRALGRALHRALAVYWEARIAKQTPDRARVLRSFSEAWTQECASGVRFDDDEKPDDIGRLGAVLTQKYLLEAADEIRPALVEHKVSGEIAGTKVQGYIDLMDTNGRIVDIKTAAREPSGIRPDYAFQIATYRQICPGASGKAAVHTLVKTKTPQLVRSEYTVSDEDLRYTQTLYPQCQEGMRAGLYFPNRGSNLCSRRNCAFSQACEAEFGGQVYD